MPRKVRVEVEGGLYHVYNRVGQGQRPFSDDVDDAPSGFGTNLKSARALYVRTLKGAKDASWIGDTVDRLPRWLVGDDREIQAVDSGPHVDVLGRSTGLERPHLSAAEYVAAAADSRTAQP